MEKKKTSNKVAKVAKVEKLESLNHLSNYDIVGVKGPYLVKDKVYRVKGNSAEAIIKSGQGKLK